MIPPWFNCHVTPQIFKGQNIICCWSVSRYSTTTVFHAEQSCHGFPWFSSRSQIFSPKSRNTRRGRTRNATIRRPRHARTRTPPRRTSPPPALAWYLNTLLTHDPRCRRRRSWRRCQRARRRPLRWCCSRHRRRIRHRRWRVAPRCMWPGEKGRINWIRKMYNSDVDGKILETWYLYSMIKYNSIVCSWCC